MTIAFTLFMTIVGFVFGMALMKSFDHVAATIWDDYRPTSFLLRALTWCGCSALWLGGLSAGVLWGLLTVAIWPLAVAIILLVRDRPHWFVIWSTIKAVFAVAISPFIFLTFLVDKWAFIALMSALWPHLDIYTPDGRLYLRRWFMTPKGQSYRPRFLHLILLADEGRDPHDHPGEFDTTILMNGYNEEVYFPHGFWYENGEIFGRPGKPLIVEARVGDTLNNPAGHTHIVNLIGPTLTWVKAWKKGRKWGFWKLDPLDLSKDEWVESEAYGEKGEERKSWTIDGK